VYGFTHLGAHTVLMRRAPLSLALAGLLFTLKRQKYTILFPHKPVACTGKPTARYPFLAD
jgi:hypothetical protein